MGVVPAVGVTVVRVSLMALVILVALVALVVMALMIVALVGGVSLVCWVSAVVVVVQPVRHLLRWLVPTAAAIRHGTAVIVGWRGLVVVGLVRRRATVHVLVVVVVVEVVVCIHVIVGVVLAHVHVAHAVAVVRRAEPGRWLLLAGHGSHRAGRHRLGLRRALTLTHARRWRRGYLTWAGAMQVGRHGC